MDQYMSILRVIALSVTLVSVFVILMATILKIIRQAEFFRGKTAVLMAASLSVLLLVALSQFLVGKGQADHAIGAGSQINAPTRYFLLPSVALGVATAVVLSQVLLLASRMSPAEKPEPIAKKSDLPVVKGKSPGRPKKKDKPAEKPPTEAAETAGETAKKVESHS